MSEIEKIKYGDRKYFCKINKIYIENALENYNVYVIILII